MSLQSSEEIDLQMIEPNEDATTTGDEIVWIEEESTAADISEMENVGGDDLNTVGTAVADNDEDKVIHVTGQVVIVEELDDDRLDKPSKLLCDSSINPTKSEQLNSLNNGKLPNEGVEETAKAMQMTNSREITIDSVGGENSDSTKIQIEATNPNGNESSIKTDAKEVVKNDVKNINLVEASRISETLNSFETTAPQMTHSDESKNSIETTKTVEEEIIENNGVIVPKSVRFAEKPVGKTDESQQHRSAVSEENLRLDEAQAKMRQNTREALELVDKLYELEDERKKQPNERSSGDILTTVVGPTEQQEIGSNTIGEGDELEAFGFRVRSELMKRPVDCIVLPNRKLLIVDDEQGLLLVSLETRQVTISQGLDGRWRSPKCACFGNDYIWVLLDFNVNHPENTPKLEKSEGSSKTVDQNPTDVEVNSNAVKVTIFEEFEKPKLDTPAKNGERVPKFEQFICRFSVEDLSFVDRIEAPKYLLEKVVVSTRICFVPSMECLYLAANTPNFGFLYELSTAKGKWTEVYNIRERNYTDIHHFAVVGPVTELFLVERNRCYVQMISVYNSKVVNDRMIGLCERPHSLCVDELGNVFIFDRATSKVSHFSRVYFQKVCDIALVEHAHCIINAHRGVLAVLNRNARELKLYRYDPRAEIEVFG